MKAVAIGINRSLQVVDMDRPAPGAGEVRVDVRFCGSDLHMLRMPAGQGPAFHSGAVTGKWGA